MPSSVDSFKHVNYIFWLLRPAGRPPWRRPNSGAANDVEGRVAVTLASVFSTADSTQTSSSKWNFARRVRPLVRCNDQGPQVPAPANESRWAANGGSGFVPSRVGTENIQHSTGYRRVT